MDWIKIICLIWVHWSSPVCKLYLAKGYWFSSFLQQCYIARGNYHTHSKNKMAVQHVFAGSSTSGNINVNVTVQVLAPPPYITCLHCMMLA